MFAYRFGVQLHQTDAYGILFFANQLTFCHDAFQAWLESVGHPMAPERAQAGFVAVVVHAESDYSAPIRVGDKLTIEYRIAAIGTTSFTNAYRFVDPGGREVGRARIVQVTIDPVTAAKMPIPPWLRTLLQGNP